MRDVHPSLMALLDGEPVKAEAAEPTMTAPGHRIVRVRRMRKVGTGKAPVHTMLVAFGLSIVMTMLTTVLAGFHYIPQEVAACATLATTAVVGIILYALTMPRFGFDGRVTPLTVVLRTYAAAMILGSMLAPIWIFG